MAGEEQTLSQALNSDNGAEESEVLELQTALHPEVKEPVVQPPEGGDVDDLENDADDRSARVDTELDDAPDEATREAIRVRRRQERLTKRQRQRDKVSTLERRLADEKTQRTNLEQRLLNLERNNMGSQLAQFTQAEEQAANAEQTLQAAIAQATKDQDGVRVAQATTQLIQLQGFKSQLATAKANLEAEAKKPPQRHLDPEMVNHANAFRSRNTWYKGATSDDEHSMIVSALDRALFKEGFDPASAAYWEELESRAAKYLPERFNKAQKGGAQGQGGTYNAGEGSGSGARRSPVAGGSGGSSGASQPGGRTKTFQLSEARVAAMKDDGSWDDPDRRKKMIARYQAYDKEHGAS
jgi:hypothetical protein